MRLELIRQRTIFIVIAAALITLSGIIFADWHSERSLLAQLESEISQQLPARILESDNFNLGDPNLVLVQIEHIQNDLASIDMSNFYGGSCEVWLQQFDDHLLDNREAGRKISIVWEGDTRTRNLELALDCRLDSQKVWASQLVFGFVAALLIVAVPTPFTPYQLALARVLRESGLPARLVNKIARKPEIRKIPDTERPWLAWALKTGYEFNTALTIACSDSKLQFDPRNSQVTIHGITVEMSPTPFMYYYWYASCRVDPALAESDGWFTNPPSNRPDRESADQLIEMMTEHGGHMKAINDLREKGLRAKILDQNRSKIKDELCGVFGEDLAAHYLFEVIRDPRTARYRYRLILDPAQVQLQKDDRAVIRNPPIPGK